MATTRQNALAAAEAAWDKKALNVMALDVKKTSPLVDYLVLATARSDIHARSVADAVMEAMGKAKVKLARREGYREGQWILLDYADFFVHVFQMRHRAFYDLEKLWEKGRVVARWDD